MQLYRCGVSLLLPRHVKSDSLFHHPHSVLLNVEPMKDIQQSCGNSESKALPFAEKLRATLKEEEEMPRPQEIEHGEATIDQK